MPFIDKDQLLQATNQGLDIILKYYPDAADVLSGRKTHFKVRPDEKTASARLTQAPDGNWIVTDFGGDQKPRNAIDVAMLEERVGGGDPERYKRILNMLAGEFGISTEKGFSPDRPQIKKRTAEAGRADGITLLATRPLTSADYRIIFSDQVRKYQSEDQLKETCEFLRFKALTGYEQVKNGTVREVMSTEFYPIYMWDEGDFQKLYFPKEHNKKYRFMVAGDMPRDYLHGLAQLREESKRLTTPVSDADPGEDDEPEEAPKEPIKLKNVIICSGGSDAMNVRALTGIREKTGYYVVWSSSEKDLPYSQYWELRSMVNDIGYLPDLDAKGQQTAHQIGLKYLDIRIIRLPQSLMQRNDWRGRSCKDVKDYLRFHSPWDFHALFEFSQPYQFWTIEYERVINRRGKTHFRQRYQCNNLALLQFLFANGFAQYRDPDTEADRLVRVEGNIVTEVSRKDIITYVRNFLKERMVDVRLVNYFENYKNLDFDSLPYREFDFSSADKDIQYLYFENEYWTITKDAIQPHSYKRENPGRYVWNTQVLPYRVKKLPDFFTTTYDNGNDRWDLQVTNTDCLVFRFLINTTRMSWRDERDGKDLTEEQRREHELHLLNRLFTIGYLLHRYKDPTRAWAVVTMENRLLAEDEASGRSGKSLLITYFTKFLKHTPINGRDVKGSQSEFLVGNVTRRDDIITIEDCHRFYDFSRHYNDITGDMVINPKGKPGFVLPFAHSPKLTFSTNFGINNVDPSTQARILYTVFSDYYHDQTEEFDKKYDPRDDFGKRLYDDFDEADWNRCINLAAQCIRFALSTGGRIDPPMNIIQQRNYQVVMGHEFEEWADFYFSDNDIPEEERKLNRFLPKKTVIADYKMAIGDKKYNARRFNKAIKLWCRMKGYELNPLDLCNEDKRSRRITRRVTLPLATKETKEEMIFLRTPDGADALPPPAPTGLPC